MDRFLQQHAETMLGTLALLGLIVWCLSMCGCAILNPPPRGDVSSVIAYQAGRKATATYLALYPYSTAVKAAGDAGWTALKAATESTDEITENALQAELDKATQGLTDAHAAMARRFAELILNRLRIDLPDAELSLPLLQDVRTGVEEAFEDWTGNTIE